jgi:hypothetical protein
MTWCWLDLVDGRVGDPLASAAAFTRDGAPAGRLTAWPRGRRPTKRARRVDARVIDSTGAAAWVSLVRPPATVRLPFDDVAVQHARRSVLADLPMDAVSTLLSDASHFEGSLTVARHENVGRLGDDPFARIFPALVVRVEAGVVGSAPPPAGPTIERYGSANPWPWDRFTEP